MTTDAEKQRFWDSLQKCINFDFIFQVYQDEALAEFYDYARDRLYDVQKQLQDEFREKFVDKGAA